jgi:hypothetical protein
MLARVLTDEGYPKVHREPLHSAFVVPLSDPLERANEEALTRATCSLSSCPDAFFLLWCSCWRHQENLQSETQRMGTREACPVECLCRMALLLLRLNSIHPLTGRAKPWGISRKLEVAWAKPTRATVSSGSLETTPESYLKSDASRF